MSIILNSERNSNWAKLVVAGCYILLIVGGITMVFPFLWMTSGSFKGKMDAYQYDLIPAFLYDDDVLFQRYLEEKYNERVQEYQIATGDEALRFRLVKAPELPTESLIRDWHAFCAEESGPTMYHLGSATFRDGVRQKIIPKNLREFRHYVKHSSDNDIPTFHRKYSSRLQDWTYLALKPERFLDRNFALKLNHALTETFNEFKQTREFADRIYLSVNGDYQIKCKADPQFGQNIRTFNELNGTNYESFAEITISPSASTSNEPAVWESYVRKYIHPQFVNVSPDALPLFWQYLADNYGQIEHLNKLYGSAFIEFHEIPFPQNPEYTTPQLFDFTAFLEEPDLLPLHYRTLFSMNGSSKARMAKHTGISMDLFKKWLSNFNPIRNRL